MRIVLVTGNYNHIPDGVSLTLNRLVGYLESVGVEVLVVSPTVENPPINHIGKLHPIKSISAPGRKEYRLSVGLGKVKNIILDFKPDLIHIATPDIAGFQTLKLAKKHQIPVVSSYHTHFSSYLEYYKLSLFEPLLWKYLKYFYANSVHTYVPSQSMIETLHNLGINSDLRIWSRGIELDKFSPAKRDLIWRQSHGIQDEEILVTFVSRLVWEKEMDTLKATFNALNKRDSRIRTMIVGDGPAGEELRLTMPDTFFTGYLKGDDLIRAYASSDIFMFPSISETFGNVTLEALACGNPAVVADAQGNKSLVVDGYNGFLISPKDVEAFVDRILEIANNPILRSQMSKNATEFASKFSWNRIFEGLFDNYNQAIKDYQK